MRAKFPDLQEQAWEFSYFDGEDWITVEDSSEYETLLDSVEEGST
jgi:hypothetical protein